MDWPIYYKDQIILLNPRSPIALCTLWSKKEDFLGAVDTNRLALVANLYTVDGISYMIKNVLAHPTIKHVVLVGHDLNGSGQVLLDLMKGGVDEEGRVYGHKAYLHRSIPPQFVKLFRDNVKVYDLRGKLPSDGPEINQLLATISDDDSPFFEGVVLPEETAGDVSGDVEDVGYIVKGETLVDVWLDALDTVMKFGEVKMTEYNLEQREVLDLLAVLGRPGGGSPQTQSKNDEEEIPSFVPFSLADLMSYAKAFFSPEKPEGVDYTYGNRLFAFTRQGVMEKNAEEMREVIDQVKAAKEKLREHPFTRRAVAVTWRPEVDVTSSNPPCLMEITWSVKFGRLYQTATFRSHDIFGAWLLNAYALRELQKSMAFELELPPGDMAILSVSAHVYKNNWSAAEGLLKHRRALAQFRPDPKGYFLISVDKQRDVIRLKHKFNDGRDSGYEFEGRSAEELYKRAIGANLISMMDHAAYLGKELERAEEALKSGETYVQDSSRSALDAFSAASHLLDPAITLDPLFLFPPY